MSLSWICVDAASRLLTQEEREAVLGDLAEANENAGEALLSILGLVVRREAEHWKSWRPWVAAFGLALPASFPLMGLSVSVCWVFPKMLEATHSMQPQTSLVLFSFWHLIPELLMLTGFAFTGGFLVGSLSRRTLWASALACLGPCLYCFAHFRTESLSGLSLLLFLAPALWGVREAVRGKRIGSRTAIGMAVGWLRCRL